MKKLICIAAAATFLLVSCKDKKSKQDDQPAPDNRTGYAQDSADIHATVISFYTWYSTNYSKFNAYDLYSGVKKADEPPYKINWDVVDKYQQFIRDSVHWLGAAFLQNQQILFKKADSAFKVDVADDVPYYFDYDWYTNTQEDPAYLLEEMNKTKLWTIKVNGDEATVDIKGFDQNGTQAPSNVINLVMKKENGKWTIAKIGND